MTAECGANGTEAADALHRLLNGFAEKNHVARIHAVNHTATNLNMGRLLITIVILFYGPDDQG